MNKKLIILLSLIPVLIGGCAMGSLIEEMMFSNKKYAENIKVETYLMKEEALPVLFSNPNSYEIKQLPYKELYEKTVYLVVRVKNNGDLGAWGSLKCKVYGRIIKVHIHSPFPFKKWNYYVISLAGAGFPRDNSMPEIEVKWEKLYTK